MSYIETSGGVPTKGDAFAKMLHFLREAQNQALILGHLHQTEDTPQDRLLASGWRGVAEMLDLTCKNVTVMATRGMQ